MHDGWDTGFLIAFPFNKTVHLPLSTKTNSSILVESAGHFNLENNTKDGITTETNSSPSCAEHLKVPTSSLSHLSEQRVDWLTQTVAGTIM